MADRVRITVREGDYLTNVQVDDVDVTQGVAKVDIVEDRAYPGEPMRGTAFVDGTPFPVIIRRGEPGYVFVAETPTGVLVP